MSAVREGRLLRARAGVEEGGEVVFDVRKVVKVGAMRGVINCVEGWV